MVPSDLDLSDVDVRFAVLGKLRELLRKKLFEDESGEDGALAAAYVAEEVRGFVEQRMRALMGVEMVNELFTQDQLAFLRLLADHLTLDDIDTLRALAEHVKEGPAAPSVQAAPVAPAAAPKPVVPTPLDPAFLDPAAGSEEPPSTIKKTGPWAPSPTVRGPNTKRMPSGPTMTEISREHAVESASAALTTFQRKMS